tara:strand:+ start:1617 stop:1979 length:363 start_codon:yes stop_codon:yes gene_type:complete
MTETLKQIRLQTNTKVTAAYAALSNDYNPLHVDADFAATTQFGAPVAHGAMALDLLMNAIEATFGHEQRTQVDIRFTAPVMVGECITAGGERMDDGFSVWVRKDDGSVVLSGKMRLGTLT